MLPFRPKRARPYLYSEQEVQQLLRATLDRPLSPRHRKRCALLPWVYYCLFGLLSVSGLRLSEARNLRVEDVDLKAGVLTIRGAKFGRTDWCHCMLRPARCSPTILSDASVIGQGDPYPRICSSPVGAIGSIADRFCRAFYAVSRQIGLRGAADSHGPRLHDLRHRFATTTLLNWYRSHQPERLLPF